MRRLSVFAFFLFLFALAATGAAENSADGLTVYFTAAVDGYLIGCDCSDGPTPGLPGIYHVVRHRDPKRTALIDGGNFRGDRNYTIHDEFLDQALELFSYDFMAWDLRDLRPGFRRMKQRARELPLHAGGSSWKGFGRLPGEGRAFVLEKSGLTVALDVAYGAIIPDESVGDEAERWLTEDPSVVARRLVGEPADLRILLFFGTVEEASRLDLPESIDAIGIRGSGENWRGTIAGIPALAVGSKGRGLGVFRFFSGPGGWTVETNTVSLRRGEAVEDPRLVAIGDAYLQELGEEVRRKREKAVSRSRGGLGRVFSLWDRPRSPVPSADGPPLEAVYWFNPQCRDCEEFLFDFVPDLARESNRSIVLGEKDIRKPEVFEELRSYLDERGVILRNVPVLVVGDRILQGSVEIEKGLRSVAMGGDAESSDGGETDAKTISGPRWEIGPVFLAGLLDGINPCAFTAMVFLISALAVAGRNRRTMLITGISYAAGVFVTYTLVGAGLLGGLRRVALGGGARQILEGILAGGLIVLTVLSVIDAYRLHRGRTDVILKLPDSVSRRIHGIIRSRARSGALLGGALVMGAVVAFLELGCTGQVYLPTIAWMISRGGGSAAWSWLLIYNTAFILPLLAIFVISYRGISASRLARVFRERGAAVKLATAGLFLAMAVLVWVT